MKSGMLCSHAHPTQLLDAFPSSTTSHEPPNPDFGMDVARNHIPQLCVPEGPSPVRFTHGGAHKGLLPRGPAST